MAVTLHVIQAQWQSTRDVSAGAYPTLQHLPRSHCHDHVSVSGAGSTTYYNILKPNNQGADYSLGPTLNSGWIGSWKLTLHILIYLEMWDHFTGKSSICKVPSIGWDRMIAMWFSQLNGIYLVVKDHNEKVWKSHCERCLQLQFF